MTTTILKVTEVTQEMLKGVFKDEPKGKFTRTEAEKFDIISFGDKVNDNIRNGIVVSIKNDGKIEVIFKISYDNFFIKALVLSELKRGWLDEK